MTRPQEPWAPEATAPEPGAPTTDTASTDDTTSTDDAADFSESGGLPVDPLWDTTALSWLTAAAPDGQPDDGPADSVGAGVDVGVNAKGGAAVVELVFAGVEPWVSGILAPTFPRRATPQFRWCAQWWRHPEAVLRLEALWRSWEVCRADVMVGIAGWLREHLDPQLGALTSPAGPFCECDPTRHFDPAEPALPLQPAPDGWWDTPYRDSLEPDGLDEQDHDDADVGAAGGAAVEQVDLARLDLLQHPDPGLDLDLDQQVKPAQPGVGPDQRAAGWGR